MQGKQNPFASFFAGGFESATHRRPDRLQVDVIHSTHHDLRAEADYRLLQQAGIFTVRDGLRWHLIERQPGLYDWSSFLPMLHASTAAGTQVIWDLCHWGIPPYLDLLSPEFVERFAAFAHAAASLVAKHTSAVPFFCAINEISFWSWIGGDVGAFYPYEKGKGDTLKRQLVRASLAAIDAVRSVAPNARFLQPEPLINIVANPAKPEHRADAERHTAAQYHVWNWLAEDPAIDGLDVIGINYYWNNQWIHEDERTPPGHLLHRPLHEMLFEAWNRYRRPLFLSETGAEEPATAGWLAYVCAEVRKAQRMGAEILGICLYPVMDYPGWDDHRHCSCGIVELDSQWQQRTLRHPLVEELRCQRTLFSR